MDAHFFVFAFLACFYHRRDRSSRTDNCVRDPWHLSATVLSEHCSRDRRGSWHSDEFLSQQPLLLPSPETPYFDSVAAGAFSSCGERVRFPAMAICFCSRTPDG